MTLVEFDWHKWWDLEDGLQFTPEGFCSLPHSSHLGPFATIYSIKPPLSAGYYDGVRKSLADKIILNLVCWQCSGDGKVGVTTISDAARVQVPHVWVISHFKVWFLAKVRTKPHHYPLFYIGLRTFTSKLTLKVPSAAMTYGKTH